MKDFAYRLAIYAEKGYDRLTKKSAKMHNEKGECCL